MNKRQHPRLQDLIGVLHRLYPPGLAEDWDNVGLQVGDPEARIKRILVTLDADEKTLLKAIALQADAIFCHHPLLFRPLKRLTPNEPVGRILQQAIKNDIAIVAAHTNLDRAAGGLNDWLASAVGLEGAVPLQTNRCDELLKLITYVPDGHEQTLLDALFAAGAGKIGAYDCCSFRAEGTGSFRPGPDCNPFIGRAGDLEQGSEWRIEVILPRTALNRVLTRLEKSHPYEEVAYDLIPLENRRVDLGLGRIGRLPEAEPLSAFVERTKNALGCPQLRLVGSPEVEVHKIAVCGGSGSFLLSEAARQGADLLLTGDSKYHEARQAEELGIVLLDAGHFATEKLVTTELSRTLQETLKSQKWEVEILPCTIEQDPYRFV